MVSAGRLLLHAFCLVGQDNDACKLFDRLWVYRDHDLDLRQVDLDLYQEPASAMSIEAHVQELVLMAQKKPHQADKRLAEIRKVLTSRAGICPVDAARLFWKTAKLLCHWELREAAIECLDSAVAILDEMKDSSSSRVDLRTHCLQDLAFIHFMRGDPASMQKCVTTALEGIPSTRPDLEAEFRFDVAKLMLAWGLTSRALDQAERALSLSRELKHVQAAKIESFVNHIKAFRPLSGMERSIAQVIEFLIRSVERGL